MTLINLKVDHRSCLCRLQQFITASCCSVHIYDSLVVVRSYLRLRWKFRKTCLKCVHKQSAAAGRHWKTENIMKWKIEYPHSTLHMGVGWGRSVGQVPPPNLGAQIFGRKRDLHVFNAILGKGNSNFLRLPANFLKVFLNFFWRGCA